MVARRASAVTAMPTLGDRQGRRCAGLCHGACWQVGHKWGGLTEGLPDVQSALLGAPQQCTTSPSPAHCRSRRYRACPCARPAPLHPGHDPGQPRRTPFPGVLGCLRRPTRRLRADRPPHEVGHDAFSKFGQLVLKHFPRHAHDGAQVDALEAGYCSSTPRRWSTICSAGPHSHVFSATADSRVGSTTPEWRRGSATAAICSELRRMSPTARQTSWPLRSTDGPAPSPSAGCQR